MIETDEYKIDISEFSKYPVFIFKKAIRPEYINIIINENIKAIRINYTVNDISNLYYLAKLTDLIEVGVYNHRVTNLEFIKDYKYLKILQIDCGLRKQVTIKADSLESLLIGWKKPMLNLIKIPTLKYLNIFNYPFLDLNDLSNCTNLNRLKISGSKLNTLEGIENMTQLEKLELFTSKLSEIKGIEKLNKLRIVKLNDSTSIIDPYILGYCIGIEELELFNLGKIPSIQFLANCKKLAKLSITGSTNITDGKISNITKCIMEHRIVQRKHYS
jgi:hypothetical protein